MILSSNVIGLFSDVQRKAAEIVKGTNQSSGTNQDEDALIQLLGPDNPGRMRAMGRNIMKTKIACFNMKHKSISEMQEKQIHLQEKVIELQTELAKVKNMVRHLSVNTLR